MESDGELSIDGIPVAKISSVLLEIINADGRPPCPTVPAEFKLRLIDPVNVEALFSSVAPTIPRKVVFEYLGKRFGAKVGGVVFNGDFVINFYDLKPID